MANVEKTAFVDVADLCVDAARAAQKAAEEAWAAVDEVKPHIGDNGNWWVGDTDTGVSAYGQPGISPHIGDNGNWFLGDKDLGVPASGDQGPKGDTGATGATGPKGDQGSKGDQGEKGDPGDTPEIGENQNWWIGGTDTGKPTIAAIETTGETNEVDIEAALNITIFGFLIKVPETLDAGWQVKSVILKSRSDIVASGALWMRLTLPGDQSYISTNSPGQVLGGVTEWKFDYPLIDISINRLVRATFHTVSNPTSTTAAVSTPCLGADNDDTTIGVYTNSPCSRRNSNFVPGVTLKLVRGQEVYYEDIQLVEKPELRAHINDTSVHQTSASVNALINANAGVVKEIAGATVTQTPDTTTADNYNGVGFSFVSTISGSITSIEIYGRTAGTQPSTVCYARLYRMVDGTPTLLGASSNGAAIASNSSSTYNFSNIPVKSGWQLLVLMYTAATGGSIVTQGYKVVVNTISNTGIADASGVIQNANWVPHYVVTAAEDSTLEAHDTPLAKQEDLQAVEDASSALLEEHASNMTLHLTSDEHTSLSNVIAGQFPDVVTVRNDSFAGVNVRSEAVSTLYVQRMTSGTSQNGIGLTATTALSKFDIYGTQAGIELSNRPTSTGTWSSRFRASVTPTTQSVFLDNMNLVLNRGSQTVTLDEAGLTSLNALLTNAATIVAHPSDTSVHVTENEKSYWDGKIGYAGGVIGDSYALTLGDMDYNPVHLSQAGVECGPHGFTHWGDLVYHINNAEWPGTTPEPHVSRVDRINWDSTTTNFTIHQSDTTIHLSTADRTKLANAISNPCDQLVISDETSMGVNLTPNSISDEEHAIIIDWQDLISHPTELANHVTLEDKADWNSRVTTDQLAEHTGDTTIHTTSTEKTSWNTHVNTQSLHVTNSERDAWNAKIGAQGGVIDYNFAIQFNYASSEYTTILTVEGIECSPHGFASWGSIIGHVNDGAHSRYPHVSSVDRINWDGKADATSLTEHTSNTSIHVTDTEKATWNAKVEESDFTTHTNDTDIHVTAEEKEKWNQGGGGGDITGLDNTFTGVNTFNGDVVANAGFSLGTNSLKHILAAQAISAASFGPANSPTTQPVTTLNRISYGAVTDTRPTATTWGNIQHVDMQVAEGYTAAFKTIETALNENSLPYGYVSPYGHYCGLVSDSYICIGFAISQATPPWAAPCESLLRGTFDPSTLGDGQVIIGCGNATARVRTLLCWTKDGEHLLDAHDTNRKKFAYMCFGGAIHFWVFNNTSNPHFDYHKIPVSGDLRPGGVLESSLVRGTIISTYALSSGALQFSPLGVVANTIVQYGLVD